MSNFLDKKNAEGYSDPTPYQAARNMIHPGEIWTMTNRNDKECEVLVVAYNDNIASVLYLMDECKDGCIPVRIGDFDYVNPRMLNWTWGGYLGKCVRKLDLQEFAEISVAIEKVLSVKIQREAVVTVNPNEVDKMKAELDSVRCRWKEADSVAMDYAERLQKAAEEATKYKIQCETMKEMYADLMEKYLQRA